MSKGKKIVVWILSILVAALFLFAGLGKLLRPAEAKSMFVQMGFAAWFAIFIGVCETLGALGMLVPRLRVLAAGGLSIIMVGAVCTTLVHHLYAQAMTPFVVLVVLIVVIFLQVKSDKA